MTPSPLRRLTVAALLLVLLPLAACDTGNGPDAETTVTVMSRNLYLGGNLFVLLDENCGTNTPVPTPVCVAMLYGTVVQSDIPGRMDAIAAEIQANAPDLIGLQEVSLYRTDPSDFNPDDPQANAQTVAFDFLELLLDALEARGLDYEVVATNENADVEFPATTDGQTFTDIRLTDRDVILARAGLQTSVLREYNFAPAITATVNVGGVEVAFTRGFSAVNVTKDGVDFTFANAHLEVGGSPLAAAAQRAQAAYLAGTGGLRNEEPLILLGDFNANPDPDPPGQEDAYQILTSTFEDAWNDLRASDTGYTCCQRADLRNETSLLDERIDLVLYRGDVRPVTIGRVGADPLPASSPVRWASDHAGVVATLIVEG